MARVQSGSNSFTIAAQKTIAETQKLLVKVAKREHAKVMNTAPRPVAFKQFVDGRANAPIEAVKPNGVILIQYPRLDLVAQFAMETLHRLSPVGPPEGGHYRDSHTLFLNGAAVSNLKGYKSGDEVTISNPIPYSRKIEIGMMKMRVPGTEQVYQRSVSIVNRRYGNLARVVFSYRGFVGGAIARGSAAVRYPVMILSER